MLAYGFHTSHVVQMWKHVVLYYCVLVDSWKILCVHLSCSNFQCFVTNGLSFVTKRRVSFVTNGIEARPHKQNQLDSRKQAPASKTHILLGSMGGSPHKQKVIASRRQAPHKQNQIHQLPTILVAVRRLSPKFIDANLPATPLPGHGFCSLRVVTPLGLFILAGIAQTAPASPIACLVLLTGACLLGSI